MNKRVKIQWISFIIAITSLISGCSASNEAGSQISQSAEIKTEPKILKTNVMSEPPSLDPALSEVVASMAIVTATFDGLMRLDKDGKLTNAVAEKVDISEDGLTYTFILRKSAWSNGDPLTAHDFEFAWKRALDPKTASPFAHKLYYIKNGEKANRGEVGLEQVGVKAQDDHTFIVNLERPTPYFMELITSATFAPVNKKVVLDNPDWAIEAVTHVGNGPFTLETWQHKSQIELVKNDQYWDKDSVALDKIELSIISDENTALSMYENGDFNWLGSPLSFIPTDAIPTLMSSDKLTLQPIAATYWYEFNTEQIPFNNAKIRKAFAYAINRQEIVDNITQTNETPALGLVPSVMELHEEGYFKDHDSETAKQLLAEGMKELGINELPPITLSFNTAELHKKIAESIQFQWKQHLGIDVNLVNKEYKVFIDDMTQGNYQIGRLGWSSAINDPIDFLQVFKGKNSSNLSRWENARYNELLDLSDQELDPLKRKELLKQAEKIFMDEMPVAPIYYYTFSWLQQDEVKGKLVDNFGKVDFKWITIDE